MRRWRKEKRERERKRAREERESGGVKGGSTESAINMYVIRDLLKVWEELLLLELLENVCVYILCIMMLCDI